MEETFGSRLEQLIADLRMNQGEFAKNLECSPAFISEVVRGLKKPGTDFLVRMATTFDVSLDWLILGVEPRFLSETTLAEIDTEKMKFIALRVELTDLASKGSTEAKKMLYELRDGVIGNDSSLERETVKTQLKASLERLKFTMKMYSQISDTKDLNNLSKLICIESMKQFLVSEDDALERFVCS